MYKDDKRTGFGKYVWANGDKYIGQWLNGVMHGRGAFLWAKVSPLALAIHFSLVFAEA
jgi:1-phosphatidylinositol-4-phosphate 5-kinase